MNEAVTALYAVSEVLEALTLVSYRVVLLVAVLAALTAAVFLGTALLVEAAGRRRTP